MTGSSNSAMHYRPLSSTPEALKHRPRRHDRFRASEKVMNSSRRPSELYRLRGRTRSGSRARAGKREATRCRGGDDRTRVAWQPFWAGSWGHLDGDAAQVDPHSLPGTRVGASRGRWLVCTTEREGANLATTRTLPGPDRLRATALGLSSSDERKYHLGAADRPGSTQMPVPDVRAVVGDPCPLTSTCNRPVTGGGPATRRTFAQLAWSRT